MTTFESHLQLVREDVQRACERAGRDPTSVRIVAASKGVSPKRIEMAQACGLTAMGESRAQSLRDKAQILLRANQENTHRPIDWHFIGHLQKNKVRYVVGRVSMVHTIDDLVVARALSNRIVRLRDQGSQNPLVCQDLKVLVQVNLGQEQAKSGVAPDDTLALCQGIDELPGLELCGLMAIPPRVSHPSESEPWFAKLAQLAQQGRRQDLPLEELSMGMSWDFPFAIAQGATIIRLGTRIFGSRQEWSESKFPTASH